MSSLIPDDEDVWYSSIESTDLRYMDVSDFARYRAPKPWYPHFSTGIKIWEDLGLRTTALATLSPTTKDTSPAPTTSQLFSILASNHGLRNLTLSEFVVPRDNGGESTFQVPLHHLRMLSLNGYFYLVLKSLRHLDHPETMDEMKPTLFRCTVGDIPGILGPCVRNYLHRDGRFRNGLEIFVNSFKGPT
jgi:hypothetical protein